MKRISLAVWIIFVLLFALMPSVQAQSPQETLNQYISDLQKNPNDNALREKIIKHIQTMKPAPAIPEEARRYFIEGNALLKAAKAQKGYGLAIDAYRQCLLIAPWWAEAYFNYAVALDLANQFDEAVNVLKLYIATNQGETESRRAQDKIYEIGAKKKLAAQEREESSPQAIAAREQNKFEDLLRMIDGRRYTSRSEGEAAVLDVKGKVLICGQISNRGYYNEVNVGPSRIEIQGRETTIPKYNPISNLPYPGTTITFIISGDGDSITSRLRLSDGEVREYIFLWQR